MYKKGENGICWASKGKVAAAKILEDKGLHAFLISVNRNERRKRA